jgi:PAS domain S-box-containing protein
MALHESETFARSLIRYMHDGVLIINWMGEILFANDAAARMAEVPSPEGYLGRNIIEFLHPDSLTKAMEDSASVQAGVEGFMSEYRLITTKGRQVWVESGGGRIVYRGEEANLVCLRDVTDRKNLEQELSHAQKMEAIGTLAGGIAHDFNNILMGIQGYVSLIMMDMELSHPHLVRLNCIQEQVVSAANLTQQLLGYARGGRYHVKPTDMNEIIRKTSSLFGRTKKEIAVFTTLQDDLWTVEVDHGQMEQVLLNLYVNAWQAMAGGGELKLETRNIELDREGLIPGDYKPGRYVKITVADTGIGMDQKIKSRIFEPFFTTKQMGRGTGLGLATVYGIVRGHAGMIFVDSEPGRGATFSVYLPASEKDVAREDVVVRETVRGKETILLVDDEAMILSVSKEILSSLGYRVYVAGSGQEAVAIYMEKKGEIDMVILDMIMPGLSGGETFDRLHEIDGAVKVLLSSGYSMGDETQKIMDRGCRGFLQKPFVIAQMSEKIREVLQKK